MHWYAVAIAPSSTRPARTVKLSRGPRNGLRRTATFSETLFEIERDFAAAGFNSFVPKDTMVIRDRKNGGHVMRTFPMLRGYAFVHDPHDWPSLERVKGVIGILGSGNVPIRIMSADIGILSFAEQQSREMAERQLENEKAILAAIEAKGRRLTRAQAKAMLPRHTLVQISHPTLGMQLATVQAVTGRETVKAMAQFLGGLVPVEVPLANVRLVA